MDNVENDKLVKSPVSFDGYLFSILASNNDLHFLTPYLILEWLEDLLNEFFRVIGAHFLDDELAPPDLHFLNLIRVVEMKNLG